MKRAGLLMFIISLTAVSIHAQSLERGVRRLAEEITRGYLDGREDPLFRPRIGVAEFSEETDGARQNAVGALASSLLTDEFSRSTVFSVIERRNMDDLMEELSLSLSGMLDEETVPAIGELQGIELLLFGSVAEAGATYIISARLVEIETGRVVAASRVEIGREEIEQESERYLASTFQSAYGISLSPSVSLMFETGGLGNLFVLTTIDTSYRVNDWLSFSLGYAHLGSSEMQGLDDERITVTDDLGGTHDVTRYFRFSADGIRLAGAASLSPSARLSLGGELAAVLYINPNLQQDFPDFPVWQPDGSGGLEISNDRILVNGYTHDPYTSYHLTFSADYLISRRLSAFAKIGAFYLPQFTPIWFESSGSVNDNSIDSDADIDRNGTFPQYQDYNFSRNTSGERIEFSALGVSVQIGMAVHF